MPSELITPQWMIEQGAKVTLANRFSRLVDFNGPIPEHQQHLGCCHIWTGAKNKGYGVFHTLKLEVEQAHRVIWMMENGPIPKGKYVLHKCDNRACVNLLHLFLGTAQDNTDDMMNKGRHRLVVLKGEQVGGSKLTWDEVREIRRLYNDEGITQKQLAEIFSVCKSTIAWSTRGKHWVEQSPP